MNSAYNTHTSSHLFEYIDSRLVRYQDLIPCKHAFIDTRSPGSDQKENFTIIGPGVSENPEQHVHIAEPHGFNIGGARQPPGCLNSQHSHLTEEVFIVHSGRWAFRTGVEANDAEVILNPGDIISIPMDVFRGFENVGEQSGYLFAILGQDNPGRVLWVPQVFEMAKQYGLVLLENGALVDTAAGQSIPEGVNVMPVTNQTQIAEHRVINSTQLEHCVVRFDRFDWQHSELVRDSSCVESPLIGAANKHNQLAESPIGHPHGFTVQALKVKSGEHIDFHLRSEVEVLFVQQGQLHLHMQTEFDQHTIILNPGDVFTTPVNLLRSFTNPSQQDCIVYTVRGGNNQPMISWKKA